MGRAVLCVLPNALSRGEGGSEGAGRGMREIIPFAVAIQTYAKGIRSSKGTPPGAHFRLLVLGFG